MVSLLPDFFFVHIKIGLLRDIILKWHETERLGVITIRNRYLPVTVILIIVLIAFNPRIIDLNHPGQAQYAARNYELPDNIYLIFLKGLGCRYDGEPDDDYGYDAFINSLSKAGIPLDNEHLLLFSYRGGKIIEGRWVPEIFGSADTGQPIEWSVEKLAELIERFSLAHPEACYILVGHSLGGRIALDFAETATDLLKKKIKGIITLNSPLVGVDDAPSVLLKSILNNSGTIWSSVAVNQIIWECGYWEELAAKRRAALKDLQKDGVHIATFSSDSDLLVRPISSCITDEKGKPVTDGFVIQDGYFSMEDIMGHMRILEDPYICQYIYSLYANS